MKILFIQPTADKQGHYGKYSVNLCQELAKQGNKVVLFTNKVFPEKFIAEKPLFEIVEFKNGKFAFANFDSKKKTAPWLYFYAYFRNSFIILKEGLKYAKERKVDIIQVTDVEFATLALVLKFFGKGLPPIVSLIHAPNFSFWKYPGNIFFRFYKVFQRELLRGRFGKEIKAIVTIGKFHQEELKKQFRLPNDFPIKVIYDGASPPKIFLSKREARQKLGIDYDGPIFLFFGMLRKDKGLEYLLEAARLIKEEEFKILIAGSPFDYSPKDISDMVMKLRLEDKIILRLGYVPDNELPYYFFGADAIIFPYLKIYTGGTGPLLKEAAIFKKPAIATKVSEMGYLVKEHNMGLLAQPENAKSLSEKMLEFLQASENQVKEWGENAFSAANTWEKMAREYVELYRYIVNG